MHSKGGLMDVFCLEVKAGGSISISISISLNLLLFPYQYYQIYLLVMDGAGSVVL